MSILHPNNGKAPDTLLGCLHLAAATLEGIENDHEGALCMGQIAEAKKLVMSALRANAHEEAEQKSARDG